MKHSREFLRRFFSSGRRKKVTEVQEQAERVRFRKIPAHVIPSLYEFGALRDWQKVGLPLANRVIVESEIGRVELLFQDRHSSKKSHRSALHPIGRTQQDLA